MFTSTMPYQDAFDAMEPRPGFDMRVICCANIPPRSNQFTYLIEMGYNQIEALFRHPDMPVKVEPPNDYAYLMFPERHLSVHEQRWMATALEAAGYKRVDVVTGCAFIVQSAAAVSVIKDEEKFLWDRDASKWWFHSTLDEKIKITS